MEDYQYVGLDVHKKYCVAVRMNQSGKVIDRTRLETKPEAFQEYFNKGLSRVVMEAGYSWARVWDILDDINEVIEKKLAHPLEVKAIANARIKTDSIDAKVLADLYRSDLIPEAYACPKETRDKKNLLRHRATLVRWGTMIKNRIHALLERHNIEDEILENQTDKFGKIGMTRLKEMNLKGHDADILRESIELLEDLKKRIKLLDKKIVELIEEDEQALLLKSMPGIGSNLASLIRYEIDDVSRFSNGSKLAAYAGLVPSTYSSGGKTTHGRITKTGNKYLRWAFCEAAQRAHVYSTRFGRLYYRIKQRKGSNTAKIALARKMAEITWAILKTKTPYREINMLNGYPSSGD